MNDTLFSVAGQIVLVSGGSRGIGRAIAAGLPSAAPRSSSPDASGDPGEDGPRKCAAGPKRARPSCAMSPTAGDRPARRDVVQKFGHIDTLINVAGVNRRMLAEKLSEADYDFILDINLKGPFLLSHAVGKHMLERGQGNQINITSLNNDRPLKGVVPYAMSKAGWGT